MKIKKEWHHLKLEKSCVRISMFILSKENTKYQHSTRSDARLKQIVFLVPS